MLPPVILMHIGRSSHSESSGGSTELPSKGFCRIFSRNHGSMNTFLPWGPPYGATGPLWARPEAGLLCFRSLQSASASAPGFGWVSAWASASASLRLSASAFGLDFGFGLLSA